MKCITNIKSTYSDGKLTMTADVVERTFGLPAQRVTVGNTVRTNPFRPRHVHLSSEAVFIKRNGVGVAFDLDELADVACTLEPSLTDAPVIVKQPTPEDLSVTVKTEVEPFYQWQASDDPAKAWNDISGATSATLACKGGQFCRCIIKNAAGVTASNAVQVYEKAPA